MHPTPTETPPPSPNARKFQDPHLTATGQRRAFVRLRELKTLWVNTGTICNIECRNCYIESSPRNDRLVPLTLGEVQEVLDEVADLGLGTEEIGFTGGEPFMSDDLVAMLGEALERGYRALVLTNAMQPLQRPRVQTALLELAAELGRSAGDGRLTFRVSLDHHTRELHDTERGAGSWEIALRGLEWLVDHGFRVQVAGRTCWEEGEDEARRGYARFFTAEGIPVNAADPVDLVLFPEMDQTVDVPEITVDCWDILGKNPGDMMCASSRMVVKRRGATHPVVTACTLLPYDPEFELGGTLAEAMDAVMLNHPHCAKFCVLGGGTCSAPPAELATAKAPCQASTAA